MIGRVAQEGVEPVDHAASLPWRVRQQDGALGDALVRALAHAHATAEAIDQSIVRKEVAPAARRECEERWRRRRRGRAERLGGRQHERQRAAEALHVSVWPSERRG
jgi:hypothetical protein